MIRILDWLYPKRCVFCNRVLPFGQNRQICEDCQVDTWVQPEPRCRICSRPVGAAGAVCRSCLVHQIQIPGYSLFPYKDEIKASIHRFKYEGQKEYGQEYARLLFQYAKPVLENAAVLIPVPVHTERLRIRGYNQAYEMASALGKLAGVPCKELLKRVRKTDVQNALSAAGRRRNLEGAFAAEKEKIEDGDLILIDDIYTSGSTVETAAATLARVYCGRKIRFLTLAMAVAVDTK